MKLDKHIAYRFLTDDELAWEIVETMHPGIFKEDLDKESPTMIRAAGTYALVNNKNQKAYYITETVLDKLDMLKVKKTGKARIKKQDTTEIIGEIDTYDWHVFKHVTNRKVTFIFPDNKLLRMNVDDDVIHFIHIEMTDVDDDRNEGHMAWVMFYLNRVEGTVCDHWGHKDVQFVEEFIFRLMCFIYLSENTEEIVQPGHRHGTRKSGKIVNNLPVQLTVVNSKWNVTSIRTEGFDVSGHFRLQPTNTGTKMVWIDPFRKHGYTRRAKSEEEK